MFKVGDIVRITQGIGKITWIGNRKAPREGNPNLPLEPVPDLWEIAVQIKNPSSFTFPYFTYHANLEYATKASPEELEAFYEAQKTK